jgi:hypothetical protein
MYVKFGVQKLVFCVGGGEELLVRIIFGAMKRAEGWLHYRDEQNKAEERGGGRLAS